MERPGIALKRLTPENCEDLLFDDVLWVAKAQEEHDIFTGMLKDRGIEVLYIQQLLTTTLGVPEARQWLLKHIFNDYRLGPSLAKQLRDYLQDLDPGPLSKLLLGGLTVEEELKLRQRPKKFTKN